MTIFFLITALLVIPAGFLIVIGDEVDPLAEARRVVAKNAKNSDDRTAVRARLEELGKEAMANNSPREITHRGSQFQ